MFLCTIISKVELLHFFWQPRNARKACPNGVPLPEWILKCREIGIVLFYIRKVCSNPEE